ncbi:MAG: DUF4333 domain-containing protein [Solirubrobacteraceae bacterium]|nr:DUF4333 domain-containing protein [Solirubrobacteraceae bacterium]
MAACGGKTIDHEDLQNQLATELSSQAGVDADQVSVSCPDGQKVEKGASFDRELTAPNGDKVRVVVTLTDDEGGYTATVPEEQPAGES